MALQWKTHRIEKNCHYGDLDISTDASDMHCLRYHDCDTTYCEKNCMEAVVDVLRSTHHSWWLIDMDG